MELVSVGPCIHWIGTVANVIEMTLKVYQLLSSVMVDVQQNVTSNFIQDLALV